MFQILSLSICDAQWATSPEYEDGSDFVEDFGQVIEKPTLAFSTPSPSITATSPDLDFPSDDTVNSPISVTTTPRPIIDEITTPNPEEVTHPIDSKVADRPSIIIAQSLDLDSSSTDVRISGDSSIQVEEGNRQEDGSEEGSSVLEPNPNPAKTNAVRNMFHSNLSGS